SRGCDHGPASAVQGGRACRGGAPLVSLTSPFSLPSIDDGNGRSVRESCQAPSIDDGKNDRGSGLLTDVMLTRKCVFVSDFQWLAWSNLSAYRDMNSFQCTNAHAVQG